MNAALIIKKWKLIENFIAFNSIKYDDIFTVGNESRCKIGSTFKNQTTCV